MLPANWNPIAGATGPAGLWSPHMTMEQTETETLPPFVAMDQAAARYHQGVLEIRAPRLPDRHGRKLRIDIE